MIIISNKWLYILSCCFLVTLPLAVLCIVGIQNEFIILNTLPKRKFNNKHTAHEWDFYNQFKIILVAGVSQISLPTMRQPQIESARL